jgi:hypothetical protein
MNLTNLYKKKIIEFELRRCETWQLELDKRKKGTANVSRRPKSSGRGGKNEPPPSGPVLTQEDEKIIKELQRLIFRQEQLLRGIIINALIINKD